MGIVVEVVNRSGQLQSREIIHKDAVSVGRAYDNDIVIDDPYVDPYHVAVNLNVSNVDATDAALMGEENVVQQADSGLTLIDNNSVNGIFDTQANQYSSEFFLEKGQIIVIGKTYLRLFPSTCLVPQAKSLTHWGNRRDCLASWKISLSLAIVFLLISFFERYLSNPLLHDKASEYVSILYTFVAIAMFGGLGALLGKIFHNDSRVMLYCSLLLSVLIVSWSLEWLLLFIFYSLDMPLFYSWFEPMAYAFIGALLIVLFLQWCSHLTIKTRILISAIIPLFVFINLSLPLFDSDRVNFIPSYDTTLLPQYFHIGHKYTPAEFVENTQDLYNSQVATP